MANDESLQAADLGEDWTGPRIGLIGPRGSGKTQFKVYLLSNNSPPPEYLRRLYRVKSRKSVKGELPPGGNPALSPIEYDESGIPYQQVYRPTEEVEDIFVLYGDESGSRRKNSFEVQIRDFPGASFISNADQKKLSDRYERLKQVENLVLIIPFWHLFPPPIMKLLVESGVLDQGDGRAGDSNRLMNEDMQNWLDRLEQLEIELQRPRRMVIAISQMGGKTLKDCSKILDEHYPAEAPNQDEGYKAVEEFRKLVSVMGDLVELERQRNIGWFRAFGSLLRLGDLHQTGWLYIEACADGDNSTAKGLTNLPSSWSPEVIAFNVIDGHQTEKTFRDLSDQFFTGQFFKQEPRSVYLVLLKFWQEAIKDRVW